MRERRVLVPREKATMIKECAYDGELALKIAVEVLEAGDIRGCLAKWTSPPSVRQSKPLLLAFPLSTTTATMKANV